MSSKHHEVADFIWSVADLLRSDYKRSDYGKVILPFAVLRRLDCVLGPTLQTLCAYIGGFSITAVTGQLDVTTVRGLAI